MPRYGNGVIYSRVSTAQQEDGTSIENQIEKCLEMAAEVNCAVKEENILTEQGSGADTMRPIF